MWDVVPFCKSSHILWWQLFHNSPTQPARWMGGRFSTAHPCSLCSQMGPASFKGPGLHFVASRRVRSPHKRLAITLSGSFTLLNDWDIPVAMVYTSDNASMRICVHVCLYKGEEGVRMEGKNTNKESFSSLSSTISQVTRKSNELFR